MLALGVGSMVFDRYLRQLHQCGALGPHKLHTNAGIDAARTVLAVIERD